MIRYIVNIGNIIKIWVGTPPAVHTDIPTTYYIPSR